MKRNVILALITLLCGCAKTAQGPAFKPALEPSNDRALVYIYRLPKFCASLGNYEISINDKYLTADMYASVTPLCLAYSVCFSNWPT